jgi:hypothetical protein
MYKPEYPEWGRREAMLWAVHEWVQDRPAYEDIIRVERLATLVGGGEYVNPTDTDADEVAAKFQYEQLNLFITLVNEDLIDADVESLEEPPYIVWATVRGLTGRGLQMIQELPDPNSSLLLRLDDVTTAIRGLQDVSPEDKDATEKALEEFKGYVRTFAPAATVQILAALAKGHGG